MRTSYRLVLCIAGMAVVTAAGCGGPSRSIEAPQTAPIAMVPLHVEFLISRQTDSGPNARCAYVEVGYSAAGDWPGIGQAIASGSHCITKGVRPYLPAYDGHAIVTTPGGDTLHVSYGLTDQSAPPPLQLTTGTFVISGGAGWFGRSTGDGAITVKVDKGKNPWIASVVLDGRINGSLAQANPHP